MKAVKNRALRSRLGALALAGIMALSSGVTAFAADAGANPGQNENGHATFGMYVGETGTPDVYQVTVDVDVFMEEQKTKEIILVLDNSGSMGYPYDLTTGIWQGLNGGGHNDTMFPVLETTGWPSPVSPFNLIPYVITTLGLSSITSNALPDVWGPEMAHLKSQASYGNQEWLPFGAYQGGADAYSEMYGEPLHLNKHRDSADYRLEWVRKATADTIESLLDPEKNPGTHDKIRIKVVAFGGGYTDVDSLDNPLVYNLSSHQYDDGGSTPFATFFVVGWGTGRGVVGGGANNPISGGFAALNDVITHESAWITHENFETKVSEFLTRYVRRMEDTYVAAGLLAADNAFNASTWNPEERHVFLLADGGDTTSPVGGWGGSWNLMGGEDPTDTLVQAAKLKNPNGTNAKIFSVGVLAPEEHNAGQVGQASYLSDNGTPNAYAETHLMRISAPLKETAAQFAGTLVGANGAVNGADFLIDVPGYHPDPWSLASVGSGDDTYKAYVDDIAANLADGYNAETANYAFAGSSYQAISAVFEDFALRMKSAASDVKVNLELNELFQPYKMPGEPLYTVTNGTVKIQGNTIKWDMDAISLEGGSSKLTFYVKFDRENANPDMYYSLMDSATISWQPGGQTGYVSDEFPRLIISGKGPAQNSVNKVNSPGGPVLTNVGDGAGTKTMSQDGLPLGGGISIDGAATGLSVVGGGFAPNLQPYVASVTPQNSGSGSKNAEKIDAAETKKAKGKSIRIKENKTSVYASPKDGLVATLYLSKGKEFKVAGVTKNYYMIQYKKKDGKVKKGYLLKSDVELVGSK